MGGERANSVQNIHDLGLQADHQGRIQHVFRPVGLGIPMGPHTICEKGRCTEDRNETGVEDGCLIPLLVNVNVLRYS